MWSALKLLTRGFGEALRVESNGDGTSWERAYES